jgi:hypothetical protein
MQIKAASHDGSLASRGIYMRVEGMLELEANDLRLHEGICFYLTFDQDAWHFAISSELVYSTHICSN